MSDPRARAAVARRELSETEAAFDKLRQASLEALAQTKPDDQQTRERLYHIVQAVDAVRGHLREIVDAGRIEQFVAEQVQSRKT